MNSTPYEQGFQAFHDGLQVEDNPFQDEESTEWSTWNDGWFQASIDAGSDE